MTSQIYVQSMHCIFHVRWSYQDLRISLAVYSCYHVMLLMSKPVPLQPNVWQEYITNYQVFDGSLSGTLDGIVGVLKVWPWLGLAYVSGTDAELSKHLDQLRCQLLEKMAQSSDATLQCNVVKTWAWLTKASVLRGHGQQADWTQQVRTGQGPELCDAHIAWRTTFVAVHE